MVYHRYRARPLQLMAEVLLVGRMAMLPLQEVLFTLGDLSVIVGFWLW